MNINYFSNTNFLSSLKRFFKELNIPVNYLSDEIIEPKQILSKTYKETDSFKLMNDVYFLGIVDDNAFKNRESIDPADIESDYDGILLFGVILEKRANDLLPTRSQLAEISRAFNREFKYTPVTIILKYKDSSDSYISLANCERSEYKQEWREGEKTGKVTILRDVSIESTHTGHLQILQELKIPDSGKKPINRFKELYEHWQKVFNVNILNKKFYQELSNWYLWAVKKVKFPNEPNRFDYETEIQHVAACIEYESKNLIRLLTRILFIWFLKERKLIPETLFDPEFISESILEEFDVKDEHNLFTTTGHENSRYYRAVLQNLFFATLNQEMGKRAFRKKGQNMNTTNLMRYESYFKDSALFIKLMEDVVPFMNGGLFECLDKPHPDKKGKQGGDVIVYLDGFSDKKDNLLQVPDKIFFSDRITADLSSDYGFDDEKTKNAEVRGLIKILESYKFTIAENTPIEEDIALDPELLGKVFENLLASYNPETKSTARKQTGSFYTPREIVDYMVDESLITHLKHSLQESGNNIEELDSKLRKLFSWERTQPFANEKTINVIINALDNCKILDPACGSGAFPMGALQKMVHVLDKLDPKNNKWKQRQLNKVDEAIEKLEEIDDTEIRNKLINELKDQKKDIEEAFDDNNLGYGRKLYLIENCIYGVDIQPIATQISKLRFFISLIVDQKIDKSRSNFGVRPLPNLESKFVTANTLLTIKKPKDQLSLFDKPVINKLENDLKKIRHKLFSIKTPSIKRKYRENDKKIREQIADKLVENDFNSDSARQLADWDPYNQNTNAAFFDTEWMFDIRKGFDVVIGNPPYIQIQKFSGQQCQKDWENEKYKTFVKTGDIYSLFYEKGNMLLKDGGILTFITSNKWMRANYGKKTRKYFAEETTPLKLIDFGGYKVFESATVDTNILLFKKNTPSVSVCHPSVEGNSKKRQNSTNSPLQRGAGETGGVLTACTVDKSFNSKTNIDKYLKENGIELENLTEESWIISSKAEYEIKKRIEAIGTPLKDWDISINYGIKTGFNEAFIISGEKKDELIAKDPKSAEIIKPILRGRDIKRYKAEFADLWLINSHNGYKKNSPLVEGWQTESDGVLKNYQKLPYNPKLKQRAKELRKAGNLSEVLFWNQVKQKKFLSLDFHRQKIIGNYIVDFYCPLLNFVVEIDGESHNFKGEYDEEREKYLKGLQLEIIHFKDINIKNSFDTVKDSLYKFCERRLEEVRNTPSDSVCHPSIEGNLKPAQTSTNSQLQEENETLRLSAKATTLQKGNMIKVPPIDINNYPAVKEHLEQYWEKLKRRSDQGITPYNLRNCVYVEEFEKEKIIFQEMVQESSFVYDLNNNYYCNDTGRIITGQNIKFLTAILNSNFFFYSVKNFYGGGALGKTGIRMKHTFFENFCIPKISLEKQLPFEVLVDMIIFAKENDMEIEAETFESVIDGMVYDLYFEEEMKEAYCYITDRISEVIKPFRDDDTDEFKREYIEKFYHFCDSDKEVFHSLIHRRNIKVIEIINGERK